MSLKRLFRRKTLRKIIKVGAVVGAGFLLGPAGAGAGARILGGLTRVGKGIGKMAAPVIDAATREQEQQAAAEPAFDQGHAAIPPEQRFTRQFGRHRPRFVDGAFEEPTTVSEMATVSSAFSNRGVAPMSLLPAIGGVLPGAGRVLGSVLTSALAKKLGRSAAVATATGAGFQLGTSIPRAAFPKFTTGGGFPALTSTGMRKSKRINPTNVKALRRALRRVEGFVKLEKRVDKILRRAAPAARQARRSGFVKSRRR